MLQNYKTYTTGYTSMAVLLVFFTACCPWCFDHGQHTGCMLGLYVWLSLPCKKLVALPWLAPSPNEKGEGLSMLLATPHTRNTIATETKTREQDVNGARKMNPWLWGWQ